MPESLPDNDDYKERMKAEYLQLKIRYGKLRKMIVKYEAGTLDFDKVKTPFHVLNDQANLMREYLYILELRSEYEGIDLLN